MKYFSLLRYVHLHKKFYKITVTRKIAHPPYALTCAQISIHLRQWFSVPVLKWEYMTWQCTPVIINYVSVSQLLYQTHPHTLFGMSLPLVFAVIRHFHIAHDASCLTPPPPSPPPPPKKRKEKENNLHKNYFQFHLGIHHFHKDHNAPCLPFKFCITIVFDFSWDEGNTREKLKTIVIYYAFIYLCFFFGGGVGWGRE